MSKAFETGHVKNVTNLQTMISYSRRIGTEYNPSDSAIELIALDLLHVNSSAAIQSVVDHVAAFNTAVNNRRDAYKGIRKLFTRLLSTLHIAKASALTIDDFKSANNKMQGVRVGKTPTIKETGLPSDATPPAPALDENGDPIVVESVQEAESKTISASQQSYDQLAEHFAKGLAVIKTVPTYNPNEPELQIPALDLVLQQLRVANSKVIDAYNDVNISRMKRNDILYKEGTGVHYIAQEIKHYYKSAFGTDDAKFKRINSIKLRMPSK